MISANEAIAIHPTENRFVRSHYTPTEKSDWVWELRTDDDRLLFLQPLKEGLSWSIKVLVPPGDRAIEAAKVETEVSTKDVKIKDVNIKAVDGIPSSIDLTISAPTIREKSYCVGPEARVSKTILEATGKKAYLYGGFHRSIVVVTLGQTGSGKTSLALAARHYNMGNKVARLFTDIEFRDEGKELPVEVEVRTTELSKSLRGAQFTITLQRERDERRAKAKMGLTLIDNPGEVMDASGGLGAGVIGIEEADDVNSSSVRRNNQLNRLRRNLENPMVDLILAVYKGRTLLNGGGRAYSNMNTILEGSSGKVINVITEGDLLLSKAGTASAQLVKKDSPLFRECKYIEEIEDHSASAGALFARMTRPHCVSPTFLVTTGSFRVEKAPKGSDQRDRVLMNPTSFNVHALLAYIINRFIKATPKHNDL